MLGLAPGHHSSNVALPYSSVGNPSTTPSASCINGHTSRWKSSRRTPFLVTRWSDQLQLRKGACQLSQTIVLVKQTSSHVTFPVRPVQTALVTMSAPTLSVHFVITLFACGVVARKASRGGRNRRQRWHRGSLEEEGSILHFALLLLPTAYLQPPYLLSSNTHIYSKQPAPPHM